MIVKELIEQFNFKLLAGESGINREVTGCYSGDLLSWVMSHTNKGNIWITVHTHINIVAVAVLGELSCIIVPENIDVDPITIQKANEEQIPILCSNMDAFHLSCEIGKFIS